MVKKIFLFGIILSILLGLTGCGETEEERLQRRVEETRQNYDDAVNDYYEFQADIAEYNYYYEKASSYR